MCFSLGKQRGVTHVTHFFELKEKRREGERESRGRGGRRSLSTSTYRKKKLALVSDVSDSR
jgi:hypothetical protein